MGGEGERVLAGELGAGVGGAVLCRVGWRVECGCVGCLGAGVSAGGGLGAVCWVVFGVWRVCVPGSVSVSVSLPVSVSVSGVCLFVSF